MDYQSEARLAAQLAREAGDILMTFYQLPPVVQLKSNAEPVTEADHAVNAYLVKRLAQAYPADGILAEESKDDQIRLDRSRVWLIDPLDGTAEFIAHNDEFCIMIGLVEDHAPVMGVIYQPVNRALFVAVGGQGAFCEQDGQRFPLHVSDVSAIGRMRPLVSRSHRTPLTNAVLHAIGAQRERMVGSLGVKMGVIARGKADFYVHANPGTKEWDTCAPNVLVSEAGGVMTDCWDRPLRYNQPDVVHRYGVFASNGAAHAQLAHLIDGALDEAGIDPDCGFAEC